MSKCNLEYKEFEKQTWKASKYMFDTIGSLYEKRAR